MSRPDAKWTEAFNYVMTFAEWNQSGAGGFFSVPVARWETFKRLVKEAEAASQPTTPAAAPPTPTNAEPTHWCVGVPGGAWVSHSLGDCGFCRVLNCRDTIPPEKTEHEEALRQIQAEAFRVHGATGEASRLLMLIDRAIRALASEGKR